jgi:hypothetical protein
LPRPGSPVTLLRVYDYPEITDKPGDYFSYVYTSCRLTLVSNS